MDKISINNLFPANKHNNYTDKPLDVHSLYNPKDNKQEQQINMDIDRLINLREERKRKLFKEYDRVFKMCMSKIHTANNLNRIELVYEVPLAVSMFPEYSTVECVDKLKRNLDKHGFECRIISGSSVYISWRDLGKKQKKE